MITRWIAGLSFLALYALLCVYLMKAGVYGLTLFVFAPVLVGGVSAWMQSAKTAPDAVWKGAAAPILAMLGLIVFRLEGLICVAMAAPLAMPLGALGGYLAYRLTTSRAAQTGALSLLIFPAGLVWDINAEPPVFAVETAVEVAAPPEEVWRHVVAFDALPEPEDLLFRAGIAHPKRARMEGTGVGAIRYCEFSTGPFVEPIEAWDAPRLLRFRVTESPAPMEEWNPFARVAPKHLHGYFVSRQGQFLLTPLPGNRTRLEGTTWYRHGLQPAQYWRWWSDAIIHRIHLRVLRHIKHLAEQA